MSINETITLYTKSRDKLETENEKKKNHYTSSQHTSVNETYMNERMVYTCNNKY